MALSRELKRVQRSRLMEATNDDGGSGILILPPDGAGPEEREHVTRAKAPHPKGEVRWRGALILPHEGAEARTRRERACGPRESALPKG